METKSRWVRSTSEVPRQEHWAILTNDKVTVPGDERSRTSPGHGYPESTTRFVTYKAFFNEEEFLHEIHQDLSRVFGNQPMGIHVDKIYTGAMEITVLETPLTKG